MLKCILPVNSFNTVSRILQSVPILNLGGNTDAIIGIENLKQAVFRLGILSLTELARLCFSY